MEKLTVLKTLSAGKASIFYCIRTTAGGNICLCAQSCVYLQANMSSIACVSERVVIQINMKVIMATNRAHTLDPALLCLGRLDRNIEFPLPNRCQKRLVSQ
ncbi:UNVERIFIED_CONTAM: 26S proteasome regulatory subunit 6B, partial [Sesamum indicum]